MESRILWETEFNHLSWDKLLVQKKINGIHKVYQIIEFRKMFAGNLSVFFRLKIPYLSSLSRKIWSFRSLGETSKHGILRDCTYDRLIKIPFLGRSFLIGNLRKRKVEKLISALAHRAKSKRLS